MPQTAHQPTSHPAIKLKQEAVSPSTKSLRLAEKMLGMFSIPIPKDLEDAEDQRGQLLMDRDNIQRQLDKRRDPASSNEGFRKFDDMVAESQAYESWKRRAKEALAFKENRLTLIEQWIRCRQRQLLAEDLEIDPSDPYTLLAACSRLFKHLGKDGVDYDPEEWNLVVLIDNVLGK